MSELKFRKGDWMKKIADHNYDGDYYQATEISVYGNMYVRQAGNPGRGRMLIHSDYLDHWEPAKLRPDFKDAKVGDKVYCMLFGYGTITRIRENHPGDYPVSFPISVSADNLSHLDYDNFSLDGKYMPFAEHPSLFHDHYQAKACFAEVFMQLNEEMKDGD